MVGGGGSVWHGASRVIIGLGDFLAWYRLVKPIVKSKRQLRKALASFVLLNGGLYFGSIFIIRDLTIPFVFQMTDSLTRGKASSNLASILLMVSFLLWYIPAYGVCLILNNRLYQEIADNLALYNNQPLVESQMGKVRSVSEEIYRGLVLTIHLGIFYFLPLVFGKMVFYWLLALPSLACLYSLYAFEYTWYRQAKPLEVRLSLIEGDIFYSFGFGIIPALVMLLMSPLYAFSIGTILFGMAVFMASLIPKSPEFPLNNYYSWRIPIFKPSLLITDTILTTLLTFASNFKYQKASPLPPPTKG